MGITMFDSSFVNLWYCKHFCCLLLVRVVAGLLCEDNVFLFLSTQKANVWTISRLNLTESGCDGIRLLAHGPSCFPKCGFWYLRGCWNSCDWQCWARITIKRYKQNVLWPGFSISGSYVSLQGFGRLVVDHVSKKWSASCLVASWGRDKGTQIGES